MVHYLSLPPRRQASLFPCYHTINAIDHKHDTILIIPSQKREMLNNAEFSKQLGKIIDLPPKKL